MLKLPRFPFVGTNARYALIGGLAGLACVLFYFLGFLFIQTIALVAYVGIFPAILIWEKKKKEREVVDPSRLSEDDRWSKTKMKVEKIERRIDKERDPATKGALEQEKRLLESELRQLEWKIRELEMMQMYNASKGNMRKIDPRKSVITKMTDLDAKFQRLQVIKSQLSNILKDVEDIMKNDPPASRETSLIRIANDLKAQFNVLKRKIVKSSSTDGNFELINELLSDYWACWVAVTALARGFPLEKDLIKYTSSNFRYEFSRFLRSVDSSNWKVQQGDLSANASGPRLLGADLYSQPDMDPR